MQSGATVLHVIFTNAPFGFPPGVLSIQSRRTCAAPSHGRPHPAILPPMTSRDSASSEITPEVLLRAYACGIFPMAESAEDPSLFWVEPEMRGVIPLDGFRIAS